MTKQRDRVIELRVAGLRAIDQLTLPLDGLTVLMGENGAGKSTLVVEALELLRKAATAHAFVSDVLVQQHGGLRGALLRHGARHVLEPLVSLTAWGGRRALHGRSSGSSGASSASRLTRPFPRVPCGSSTSSRSSSGRAGLRWSTTSSACRATAWACRTRCSPWPVRCLVGTSPWPSPHPTSETACSRRSTATAAAPSHADGYERGHRASTTSCARSRTSCVLDRRPEPRGAGCPPLLGARGAHQRLVVAAHHHGRDPAALTEAGVQQRPSARHQELGLLSTYPTHHHGRRGCG
jgi:energy-coupling factor transporter ATP-binding protein EcfA2